MAGLPLLLVVWPLGAGAVSGEGMPTNGPPPFLRVQPGGPIASSISSLRWVRLWARPKLVWVRVSREDKRKRNQKKKGELVRTQVEAPGEFQHFL